VVAEPDTDTALDAADELTVCSGRLVVGAPGVMAARGADVDTGDGSGARAKVHRAGTAWAASSSVEPRSAEGRWRPVPAPRP
jgi:hypothetical protein